MKELFPAVGEYVRYRLHRLALGPLEDEPTPWSAFRK